MLDNNNTSLHYKLPSLEWQDEELAKWKEQQCSPNSNCKCWIKDAILKKLPLLLITSDSKNTRLCFSENNYLNLYKFRIRLGCLILFVCSEGPKHILTYRYTESGGKKEVATVILDYSIA